MKARQSYGLLFETVTSAPSLDIQFNPREPRMAEGQGDKEKQERNRWVIFGIWARLKIIKCRWLLNHWLYPLEIIKLEIPIRSFLAGCGER